jgi:cytochrome P450
MSSMKKTEVNPFDSESANRYEAFRQMRSEGPIHQTEGGQLFVVQQAAVEQGLKSVDNFVGSFGDLGQMAEEETVMAAIPEPRHGKIRKLFNSALAYNHASQVEPFVRRYAAERLEEGLEVSAREGEVEIMAYYARRIPSAVIAEVLGIPNDRIDDFARWSDELLERQGAQDQAYEPIAKIHPEFSAYLDDQITQRLEAENPPNDMITRLLQTEIEGEKLSRRAVLTQSIFLIVAGNETTRNLIGNILYRLAEDAELYAQVRKDRELIPSLIEESLRFDTPVQLLARTCTEEIEIAGTKIQKGDRLLYSIASANRDENVYPDADQFRLDRKRPRDHVGFGAGPHICPGAFLARMEAQVAVETLLDRVAKIELAPGYEFDPNPVFWAYGPQSLRVVLTPA